MKYAILGSNCFSAQDLASYLASDPANEILCISRGKERGANPRMRAYGIRKNIHYRDVDLVHLMPKALTALDDFRPDYVINYTAFSEISSSWTHPRDYILACTVTVADMIRHFTAIPKGSRRYLKRFVQIGTPEIYGPHENATESHALNPTTPYAAAKACADQLVEMYCDGYQVPFNIVRSSNVYGVGQQLYRIIPKSILKIKLGQKIELRGGGHSIKNYINIRDVSRGTKLMLEKGKPDEIYHLGSGQAHSIRNIVHIIANKLGKKLEDVVVDIPRTHSRDSKYILDSSKAKEHLGWVPEIELKDGIDEVIQWIDRNIDDFIHQPIEHRHVA
jgi:dTDP-glucose 4,6-dehydratase